MHIKDIQDLIDYVASEQVKKIAMETMRECANPATSTEKIRILGGQWKGLILMKDALQAELKKREDTDD